MLSIFYSYSSIKSFFQYIKLLLYTLYYCAVNILYTYIYLIYYYFIILSLLAKLNNKNFEYIINIYSTSHISPP